MKLGNGRMSAFPDSGHYVGRKYGHFRDQCQSVIEEVRTQKRGALGRLVRRSSYLKRVQRITKVCSLKTLLPKAPAVANQRQRISHICLP